MIGCIDTGRIVDRVRVDPPTRARVFDASKLRAAEIAAFGHHLATEIVAVDAQRIVRAIADLRVRLAFCLDVRADAAVVNQIDRRLQDRIDELGRRHRFGLDRERFRDLRRHDDRFCASRMHAAARRNERRVVIGPR